MKTNLALKTFRVKQTVKQSTLIAVNRNYSPYRNLQSLTRQKIVLAESSPLNIRLTHIKK